MTNRLKPLLLPLSTFLLALALIFAPFHPDRFRVQAYLGVLLLGALWAVWISKELKFYWGLPLLLYCLWSAFDIVATPPFGRYGYEGQVLIGSAGYGLSVLVLALTGAFLLGKEGRKIAFQVFEYAAVLSACCLILHKPGLFDNLGIDATFLACIYPSLLFRHGVEMSKLEDGPYNMGNAQELYHLLIFFAGIVLPLVAIFMSFSATGIFCLVAVFLSMALMRIRDKNIRFICLGSSLMVFLLGYGLQADLLFHSTGRVGQWRVFYAWIQKVHTLALGAGLGVFEYFAPRIQALNGSKQDFFLYAHNEYFQIVFDLGLIGLGLAGVPVLVILWKTFRQKSWLFMSLCAIGVGSLAQSPLRIVVFQFWCTLIFVEAICETQASSP